MSTKVKQLQNTPTSNQFRKFSTFIIGNVEDGFSMLGLKIATYPVQFMLGCVIIVGLCGIGLLEFREEIDPDKLWLPDGHRVRVNKEWIYENTDRHTAFEKLIVVTDNILKADKIKALYAIHEESLTLQTSSGVRYEDICERAGSMCMVFGILEIWSFDNNTISALTDAQVLLDIKNTKRSPVYGNAIDLTSYLGSRTYNSAGDLIGAKAASCLWRAIDSDELEDYTESWETEFVAFGLKGHSAFSEVYVVAGKSFDEEYKKAIDNSIITLSAGYCLVIFFVIFALGNLNFIEQRIWLTMGGMLAIGFSAAISYGLASALQQAYGPVQSVLPFLLLGLGVDDMFVIMGSLNNLTPEESALSPAQKLSTVLRHAGVAITVTSLTDFVAFAIGATTAIPTLKSFAVAASLGILALYFLQAVFFSSCLFFDISRIDQNRDGCFFFKRGKSYKPNSFSKKQLIPYLFKNGLARISLKMPFRAAMITVFFTILGVNLYGLTNLKTSLDIVALIPSDSYAYKFFKAENKYFPSNGVPGNIYCTNIDYFSHKTELETLSRLMSESTSIVDGTTDSWFTALTDWLSNTTDPEIIAMLDANRYPKTEEIFVNLTYRLTTDQAPRTEIYVYFDTDDTSNVSIYATRYPLLHVRTTDTDEEWDVMTAIYDIIAAAGFSTSECFPYAIVYHTWETNAIIQTELYRNISLAMMCVFLVTLVLIVNLKTCLLVVICVAATLINVAGTMQFWGLTIDTVTTIVLILSVGLSVDFSAHIGHMFMSVKGTKEERVRETIIQIGPAVFYGGFSTFLAFVLLSTSNTYVFNTFFKLNFLTVIYGMFHGLIFLPVMLGLFGPEPYPSASIVCRQSSTTKVNGIDNLSFHKDKESGQNGNVISEMPFQQSPGKQNGHIISTVIVNQSTAKPNENKENEKSVNHSPTKTSHKKNGVIVVQSSSQRQSEFEDNGTSKKTTSNGKVETKISSPVKNMSIINID